MDFDFNYDIYCSVLTGKNDEELLRELDSINEFLDCATVMNSSIIEVLLGMYECVQDEVLKRFRSRLAIIKGRDKLAYIAKGSKIALFSPENN